MTNCLYTRFKTHSNSLSGYFNGKKEIWDLTAKITEVYKDIKLWNERWAILSTNEKNDYNIRKKFFNDSKLLLWFNSRQFFNSKLDIEFNFIETNRKNNINGDTHNSTLEKLNKLNGNVIAKKLIESINESKELITNNISIAYYIHPYNGKYKKSIKWELEKIEATTKWALEQLGIYTYGHATGKGTPIYNTLKDGNTISENYEIDLSKVQDKLVDMGKNELYYREGKLIINSMP